VGTVPSRSRACGYFVTTFGLSLAMWTRCALIVGAVGFACIFFGLQIGTSPLSDVVDKAGNVIATCRAGLLYSWPGEGIPDIVPPPGPRVANGVPTPCPYGTLHPRAEIDVNNDGVVRLGALATVASVIWQIFLVRGPERSNSVDVQLDVDRDNDDDAAAPE
jgi:hypothetical protein